MLQPMVLANVAIPTVIPHVIVGVILLPLVAAVEAMVIKRLLLGRYGPSLRAAWGANWRSTIVGLPLGYLFALAGVIPAGIFSALIPEAYRQLFQTTLFHIVLAGGMVPNESIPLAMAIGTLVVLIPYFFVSVRVESRYLQKNLPDADEQTVRRTVWIMNGLTYACLVAFVAAHVIEVAQRPIQPQLGHLARLE